MEPQLRPGHLARRRPSAQRRARHPCPSFSLSERHQHHRTQESDRSPPAPRIINSPLQHARRRNRLSRITTPVHHPVLPRPQHLLQPSHQLRIRSSRRHPPPARTTARDHDEPPPSARAHATRRDPAPNRSTPRHPTAPAGAPGGPAGGRCPGAEPAEPGRERSGGSAAPKIIGGDKKRRVSTAPPGRAGHRAGGRGVG